MIIPYCEYVITVFSFLGYDVIIENNVAVDSTQFLPLTNNHPYINNSNTFALEWDLDSNDIVIHMRLLYLPLYYDGVGGIRGGHTTIDLFAMSRNKK
jgi:hypothetical protein